MMRKIPCLILCSLLLTVPVVLRGLLLLPGHTSKKIVLQPLKDTYISQWPIYCKALEYLPYSDVKYSGGDYDIKIVAWTNKGRPVSQRALIAFDVGIISPRVKIVRALLKLYGLGHNPLTHSNAAYLQRITAPWEEYRVNWYNQPATTQAEQKSLDCSYTPDQNYFIDVTTFVRGWVTGKYPNHGLMMRLQNEEPYSSLFFASSDNPQKAIWPVLEIEYREADDTPSKQ